MLNYGLCCKALLFCLKLNSGFSMLKKSLLALSVRLVLSFWVICEFVISCHCLVEMSDLTFVNLQMENKLTFWKDFILIRADTSLPNIPFHNCHCFQQQKNALSVSFVSDSCRLPVFCSICNYWKQPKTKVLELRRQFFIFFFISSYSSSVTEVANQTFL